MNSKRVDISVGVSLSVLSVAIFLYANEYKGKGVNEYGPNMFPQFLALLLFIASILLVVNAIKGKSQTDLEGIDRDGFIRTGITIAISIGYLIAMQYLGFFIATLIFLYAMIAFLGQKGVLVRVISTVSVSLIVNALFKSFLKIPLPEGLLSIL